MTGKEIIGNAIVSFLLRIACTIDARDLNKVPQRGPAILLSNHTSNIEGPLYYIYLRPRKATALGKEELWKNPVTRFLMEAWNIIPVRRGMMDRKTLKACLRALDHGYILGVAPEGTRSKTGALLPGRTGATYLATQRKVPIIPMVQWGLHRFAANVKKLKKTRVTIRVGRPFFLEKPPSGKPTPADRRAMTREMMYQMALLLPPSLRGAYSDIQNRTSDYLRFTSFDALT
jgi:1-acyl-sn-glycerol-3-phosphate acyltransferase